MIMDVLRNRTFRLEMVMYLLSVITAIGGCGCTVLAVLAVFRLVD